MGLLRQPADPGDRISRDLLDGQFLVDDAIDEGGIGAVLQQAAHQIGQQVLMAAAGRIGSAGIAAGIRRHDVIVERLAHAMQALELKVAAIACQLQDRGDGMGVMGGELRIEGLGIREQALGGCQE